MSTIIATWLAKLGLTNIIIKIAGYVLRKWVLRLPDSWADPIQVRTFLLRGLPAIRKVAESTTDIQWDDKFAYKADLLVRNDVAFAALYSIIMTDLPFEEEQDKEQRQRRRFKIRERFKGSLSSLPDEQANDVVDISDVVSIIKQLSNR